MDPPYNTGKDSFRYNDKFNHSTWMTFMKNRLEIAKELLSEDGCIWLNIDDDEGHYLKVLADGVFGRENFINNVIWEKSTLFQMTPNTYLITTTICYFMRKIKIIGNLILYLALPK
ncbi:site-specific DNA-methyltransferase [Listeria monocytogenes]|nr:site-specific DNA-methyltransferase [Listeria monocytogenes]